MAATRHLGPVGGDDAGRRRVRAEVSALARAAGLPAARVADLDLAVHEVLVNAVEHGHAGDPRRPVEVAVTRLGTGLEVRVRDGGPGRDAPRPVPVPAPAERGRGLTLARGLVDDLDLRVDAGGTEVVLRVAVEDLATVLPTSRSADRTPPSPERPCPRSCW